MKKLFTTLFLLAAPFIMTYSQVKEGSNFEIGGGYNFVNSKNSLGLRYSFSGPGAYFEYRYEADSHFYLGGQINYKYANGQGYGYTADGSQYNCDYHQVCPKFIGGYTFLATSVVSPYVGLGFGIGGVFSSVPYNDTSLYFFWNVSPRVGVQIWKFRLTCDFDCLCDRIRVKTRWSPTTSYRSGTAFRFYGSIVSLNLGFTF